MAKISARGARTLCQVKASKPEPGTQLTHDAMVHLTLTLASDGRVLRQTHHNFRSSTAKSGYRRSASGMTVVTKLTAADIAARTTDQLTAGLARLARRLGFTPDSEV
jgi:phage terminase small subunit